MSLVAGGGALGGLRVVEIGQMIAGPFCGHLFADHGAVVVKVEPPGDGDVMRRWGGMYKGLGLYWPLISRGKRSVTLDLRLEEGISVLRDLLATTDVLVENFRPGTLERWGIGWDELARTFPRLIVVRISGYGQTGPYRDRPGFGSVGEAMSGFRYISGEAGRRPVRVGISIGDALAGTHGFIGALLALYARDVRSHQRGQLVDVGIYEAMWAYMEAILPEFEKLGRIREPMGPLLPGIAPSSVYPTSDGEWVVIGANGDSVFRRFAAALGRDEWARQGSRYATHEGRGSSQIELDDAISEWTRDRTTADVLSVMERSGVPAGRLYTAKQIANDAHYAAREMVLEVAEPNLGGEVVRMQGIVPKLNGTPGRVMRGGPLLGEHNEEILGALVGHQRLAGLRQRGVV